MASADVTVMLLGASGTGKELLARGLHDASPRREGAFVAINCAAIPETLLEAELFGHEKGAFTGAIKTTEGKIEQAGGGTLFLDEVGDIPLPLQVKLLRFLQERAIERIGGRKSITVDTRIVCATHQNLEEMIAAGTFREDLYYRLAEIVVRIPSLAERHGDPGSQHAFTPLLGIEREGPGFQESGQRDHPHEPVTASIHDGKARQAGRRHPVHHHPERLVWIRHRRTGSVIALQCSKVGRDGRPVHGRASGVRFSKGKPAAAQPSEPCGYQATLE